MGLKVGDKVKIVKNDANHGYPIGTILTIVEEHSYIPNCFKGNVPAYNHWFYGHDVVLVKRVGFSQFMKTLDERKLG